MGFGTGFAQGLSNGLPNILGMLLQNKMSQREDEERHRRQLEVMDYQHGLSLERSGLVQQQADADEQLAMAQQPVSVQGGQVVLPGGQTIGGGGLSDASLYDMLGGLVGGERPVETYQVGNEEMPLSDASRFMTDDEMRGQVGLDPLPTQTQPFARPAGISMIATAALPERVRRTFPTEGQYSLVPNKMFGAVDWLPGYPGAGGGAGGGVGGGETINDYRASIKAAIERLNTDYGINALDVYGDPNPQQFPKYMQIFRDVLTETGGDAEAAYRAAEEGAMDEIRSAQLGSMISSADPEVQDRLKFPEGEAPYWDSWADFDDKGKAAIIKEHGEKYPELKGILDMFDKILAAEQGKQDAEDPETARQLRVLADLENTLKSKFSGE